ncbi:5275_t:CDS:2, partial [Scutellospora calospora]
NYLMIEYKGLEPKVIKDYARFMVMSNYDAPLQIEIEDHHIYPDVPSVVIAYLLSLDLSNWSPQEILSTKMKVDLIQNREKLLTSKVAEKKFSQIGIETKFCESGLSDIKEFSDTPQSDLPENETADIPIFNILEILINTPSKETDSSKPINKVLSAILLSRAQHKKHLRKRAIELSKNPNIFVTITKKDRLNSIAFCDKIKTDAWICGYAKKKKENAKEYMDMLVRKRLIEEEIIYYDLENKETTSS